MLELLSKIFTSKKQVEPVIINEKIVQVCPSKLKKGQTVCFEKNREWAQNFTATVKGISSVKQHRRYSLTFGQKITIHYATPEFEFSQTYQLQYKPTVSVKES